MQPFIKKINSFIQQNNLIPQDSKIILGLSGGPDSIFLLHLLAPLHHKGIITLTAAHLDHEWRPESGKDVKFCQQATVQLGVQLVNRKISDLGLDLKFNGSREELARKARRHFLEQVRTDYQANLIAVGHHANDQQETFFIRLIRGASLTGLTAMKPKNDEYIRPLLQTYKADILAYLTTNNIPYLLDYTNESDDYLRNRIRNQVLPALQKTDARFDANFSHALERLHETEKFLDMLTQETFEKLVTKENNLDPGIPSVFLNAMKKNVSRDEPLWLNLPALCALDPVIQQRILVRWLCIANVPFTPSSHFFAEIMRFLHQPGGGEHAIHQQWSLLKKKKMVSIKHKNLAEKWSSGNIGEHLKTCLHLNK